jgi:pimeloyl-ACP methyl ester carboxylesterase
MTPEKSGFAPVNGLQMYYETYGSGNPLILIHGGGSTIESNWETMIPLLSPSFEVIAIETQSHGRTADIDRDFTFEQDADDIAGLLKYFKIPKADLFGFSNGGQIALQVAIRHPTIVKRMIVASAGYKRDGFQSWFWPAMQNPSVEHMPPQLKEAFLKVTPDEERFLKMFWRDANRMKGFQSWKDQDIDSIKSPALVAGGDNDVVTVEHMVEIYRRISGSRLALFPGGHGDYLVEIPGGHIDPNLHKAFANLVVAFLNEK